ncbi:DEAD/DEAH box helicase [Rhodobacter calidifons]|uniref:DEAD/DEAH box helicase family protein n=1 Tax=Rhodobacter calidifons TaxID=2715277 RepID=A0ABX0GBM7_9RHOB|nr:DEAD/DEAH box helicase family protein [Rhodobacter calidifons]NHB78379.1 DEAD/DEAH box helicase family protein [Rhodobacter calidifons]
MRLRPRQSLFVERSLAALCDHGNTLSIASTGFGKTIALSAVVAKSLEGNDAKACVFAHRDELTAQNRAKFGRVAPEITTSVVDAEAKSWAGRATFAMVPTLSRPANLAAMPALDLLVIDEAHHAVADSYRRIIDHVRGANPACRIFGVTATPNRGDRKGLREIFDNVGDQVKLGELIASGHLVPSRTFVIDVGVQDQLRAVRKSAADYDMTEVAQIMNRAPVTDEVVRHWQDKASERPTVVFCSTVAHAENVAAAFNAAGVADTSLITQAIDGTPCELVFAWSLGANASFTSTAHAVYLPRPRIEIPGPQGIQATFDWQAAKATSPARMCTAVLVNTVATY